MSGKKILLAICGSIAAYKSAYLTRLLVKAGAEVKVLMTPAATEFISPLTLSTLSKNKAYTQLISEEEWQDHVALGCWADALVIAPATANTISKLAHGQCDSIVTAVYLCARCPVIIAPAMDLDMWNHPATRANMERLASFGNIFTPVGHGELASGLVGEGRMAEPEQIAEIIFEKLSGTHRLEGVKALVTAGPTYEPIDPVRFIGNYSSGKMGIAIARELAKRGAQVSLVLGPSNEPITEGQRITVHRVKTAAEMHERAIAIFPDCQVAVLAAAVADFRPVGAADEKIKKTGDQLTLVLEKTPDIAESLSAMKNPNQCVAGFALETDHELENARQKLQRKQFDFIVLNSLREKGAGFDVDTNKITILQKDNTQLDFQLKPKSAVAVDIVNQIEKAIGAAS